MSGEDYTEVDSVYVTAERIYTGSISVADWYTSGSGWHNRDTNQPNERRRRRPTSRLRASPARHRTDRHLTLRNFTGSEVPLQLLHGV